MTSDPVDVLAIGNAIVDVLVHCDDTLLDKLDLPKGSMSLVDANRADEIYAALGAGVEMSGGSAANTATGVASLGGRAAFIGKVGHDEFGTIFRHDLSATGVSYEVAPAAGGSGTAHCIVMVTPDGQRTMATHLGTAGCLAPGDVDGELVARSRIVFIEGYLVGLPSAAAAINTAVEATRRAGGRLALTLSDARWVAAQRELFNDLINQVDILLANEAEVCQLTGAPDALAALKTLAGTGTAVAVTCSERGAWLTDGRRTIKVAAEPGLTVVDTTGAGDLFAAGFLLGLARDLALADAGRLGAICAAEVISHLGARPQSSLAELAENTGAYAF